MKSTSRSRWLRARRERARQWWALSTVAAVAAGLVLAGAPSRAEACGCLSPPDPVVLGDDDFAVNQQAEQIIFEVEDGTITAHVLIRYAGDPSQFAWIVPVPSVPELDLSPTAAFAMIDDATRPFASVQVEDVCPVPEYECEHHQYPVCSTGNDLDGGGTAAGDAGDDGLDGGTGGGDEGGAGDGSPPPGIDVIDMEQVGSYETVTFSATEADLAVQWLQDNGFIVNDSMTPYMMPYVEAGMIFVAAKLVAGAGIDAIEPLRLTYADTQPMIPLMLTAVASEPHLTVTSYIYGDTGFRPSVRPIAVIDPDRVATDLAGRINYPQLLARTVDEIGGDGWVVEYGSSPPVALFPDSSGCCADEFDFCGLGGDMQCQCPESEFDADDCGAIPGLLDSIALVNGLAQKHSRLTRLSTRISPEEMTYDPTFEVDPDAPIMDRLTVVGTQYSLASCETQVIDDDEYAAAIQRQACSATYCGAGECVITNAGPGCRCDGGFVARRFTDLDGLDSITCVPEVPPVDLSLNTVLPDLCLGVDCGSGTCVDLGGVPSCDCDEGNAGVALGPFPSCSPIQQGTATPGAENFTTPIVDIAVCAPPPPECGQWGWLVPAGRDGIHGEMCPMSIPAPEDLQIPPKPTCADLGMDEPTGPGASGGEDGGGGGGCGCVATGDRRGVVAMMWGLVVIAGWRLRRHARR